MWKSKKKLARERDEAWLVADRLRDENHLMWQRLIAAGELARVQLRLSGHGLKCSCRLCEAARITLNLSTAVQQPLMGCG